VATSGGDNDLEVVWYDELLISLATHENCDEETLHVFNVVLVAYEEEEKRFLVTTGRNVRE